MKKIIMMGFVFVGVAWYLIYLYATHDFQSLIYVMLFVIMNGVIEIVDLLRQLAANDKTKRPQKPL